MVFITHDIDLASKTGDRVYVLDHGRMVEHGAAFEVFGRPADSRTRNLIMTAYENIQKKERFNMSAEILGDGCINISNDRHL